MIRGLFLDIINQSIAAGYLIAAVIAARAQKGAEDCVLHSLAACGYSPYYAVFDRIGF